MIIARAGIQMETTHALEVAHRASVIRRETTREDVPGENRRPEGGPTAGPGVIISLSPGAGIHYSRQSAAVYSATDISSETQDAPASEKRAKLMVLLKTMEKMTGRSYHFSEFQFEPAPAATAPLALPTDDVAGKMPPAPPSPEGEPPDNRVSRVETLSMESHYENENTGFTASGMIHTSDGREINIDVQLNMSREFYNAHVTHTIETGPVTDPLAIAWDGAAAELTEKSYLFDLDSDGVEEQISFIKPGTGGFLAYDRNQDGTINNGQELFGPTRGNGFAELAAHDADGNGWIDEADDIFHNLAIWTRTSGGDDQLIALADTGIGAIYLRAGDTPFSLTTAENEKLGQIQRTSVYLKENGSAGIIQQIDLVAKMDSDTLNNTIETVV